MNKNFGGVVWTSHAIRRMRERGIRQGDAWAAWKRPDSSRFNKRKGVFNYQRKYHNEVIEVAAIKNGEGKWVVLSVWNKKIPMIKRTSENKRINPFLKLLKGLFTYR